MRSVPALRASLRRLAARALDFLFTPRCVGCDREGSYLCEPCLGDVPRLQKPYRPGGQPRSGDEAVIERPRALSMVYSPFALEGAIRQAVHDLKYRGVRALARQLGAAMAEHARTVGIQADVLVPVPLHRTRLRERGYNQAALLADEVGRCLGLPVKAAVVSRVRPGRPQAVSGGAAQRWEEVRDAFQAQRPPPGRRVLLIDDVCTTGATLDACAHALKAAGAEHVVGLTLARQQ